MRLRTETKALKALVSKLRPFWATRGSLPVLKAISLVAAERVVAEATDLEVSAGFGLDAEVAEVGQIVVGAKALADAVKAIRGDTVEISTQPSGRALMSEPGGVQLNLETFAPEDYPSFPEPSKSAVPLGGYFAELADAINRVSTAAGTDGARPILTSVCLQGAEGGTIKVVATDSYRLAHTTVRTGGLEGEILWPARRARAILKAITPTAVLVDEMRSFIVGDDGIAAIRHIDGTFPRYESLFPERGNWVWECEADEIRQLLAFPLANYAKTSIPVRIDTGGGEAHTQENGAVTWKQDLPGRVQGSHHAAYDPRYLADTEAIFGKAKVIRAYAAKDAKPHEKPLAFSDDHGYKPGSKLAATHMLLMPVRL